MPGGVLWAKAQLTENRELVQRVLREGPGSFDEIYAADLVNHPPLPTPGPAGMKEVHARYAEAFSNMQTFIEYQFEDAVDKDRVITVWRITGELAEDFETPLGTLEASNEPVELWMITIVRVENGKIVERWGQI